jgi:CheY-like chemotaxis protein
VAETRQPILIVEDDVDLRETLCSALGLYDLQVVGVKDGDEALDFLVFQSAPAAIILDLRLPGELNGWDLLHWMRRDPDLKDVPVIVVSGAPFERVELTEVHCPVAMMKKPVDPAELLAVLRGAVSTQDMPW